MIISKHCVKCIILVVIITVTQSYKLRQNLDDKTQKKFETFGKNQRLMLENERIEAKASALLNFLLKHVDFKHGAGSLLEHVDFKGVDSKKQEKIRRPKKILVKKVVQHGEKTPETQNIDIFGLSYKPLLRIHKGKNVNFKYRSDFKNNIKKEFDEIFHEIGNNGKEINLRSNKETTVDPEAHEMIKYLSEIDSQIAELRLPYLTKEWYKILENTYNYVAPQVKQLYNRAVKTVATYKQLRTGKPLTMVMIKGDEEELNLFHRPREPPVRTRFIVVSDRGPSLRAIGDGERSAETATEDIMTCKAKECKKEPKRKQKHLHHFHWESWGQEPKIPGYECPGDQILLENVCIELPIH